MISSLDQNIQVTLSHIGDAAGGPLGTHKMRSSHQRMSQSLHERPSGSKAVLQKDVNAPAPLRKLSPDYESTIYDSLRSSVTAILSVSSKFQLLSSRTKGIVLTCGSDDNKAAMEAGLGISLIPLKTMSNQPGIYTDNPLILVLGQYARRQEGNMQTFANEIQQLPRLVLGFCCNNWSMYYGRNALIEAILEVLGAENASKLSIHSAVYALSFNAQALAKILMTPQGQEDADSEQAVRALHASGFKASAAKYNLAFDAVEKDEERFGGVSKSQFVEELSKAVAQAVERTMANDGKRMFALVMDIMRLRRLIQDNLSNKRFRRAHSQNGISSACSNLSRLFAENFGNPEITLAPRIIPGWKAYTDSNGGVALALTSLFGHSIDVLAGCVARAHHPQCREISPDIAERLVLTVLDKEQRLLEYCFNQVYELMPCPERPTMYLYRRVTDLHAFSTIPCGAVEMGGKV